MNPNPSVAFVYNDGLSFLALSFRYINVTAITVVMPRGAFKKLSEYVNKLFVI